MHPDGEHDVDADLRRRIEMQRQRLEALHEARLEVEARAVEALARSRTTRFRVLVRRLLSERRTDAG